MVSFYFPPNYSGSSLQALALCRQLKKQGLQSTIVSANLSGAARSDEVDGIPIIRLPVLKNRNIRIVSFWLSLSIHIILNRRKYDIIHAHGTVQHGIVGLLGRILNKPTILKIAMANSDIAFAKQGRLWGRIQRYLVSKFDRYIAISSEVRTELLAANLGSEHSILSIPNGVDTDRFGDFADSETRIARRHALGLDPATTVLFVGIIIPRKNLDTILKAWKTIIDRGLEAHLMIVGPTPDNASGESNQYLDELKDFIKVNALGDSISFEGFVEDPTEQYRASDIFFFPSRREGMPNVVLEAMASGLPSLVADFSGASDLISNGETGFIAEANDHVSFADELERLLLNRERRETIGRQAWQKSQDHFSLRSVGRKVRTEYAKLLSNKQRNNG